MFFTFPSCNLDEDVLLCHSWVQIRVWRSLVSRLTGGQEAAGSSPVTRTKNETPLTFCRRCFIFALVGYVNLRPLALKSAAQRPSERSSDGRRFKSCHFVGAKSVLLRSPLRSEANIRSLPCSSSPNRTRCAGLRFGFLFFPPFPYVSPSTRPLKSPFCSVRLCEVPLENTKQIPSYPKIQGYA